MSDKKGLIAAGDIFGMLIFMFAAVISLLLFYGCQIAKEQQEYEEIKDFKDKIEATKALNFFLEMHVDEEKKVMDLVIESVVNDDYGDLNALAVDYFQPLYPMTVKDTRWRLQIWPTTRYDSVIYNDYPESFCTAGGTAEIKIPLINENLELTELKVTLFVTEKCHA